MLDSVLSQEKEQQKQSSVIISAEFVYCSLYNNKTISVGKTLVVFTIVYGYLESIHRLNFLQVLCSSLMVASGCFVN